MPQGTIYISHHLVARSKYSWISAGKCLAARKVCPQQIPSQTKVRGLKFFEWNRRVGIVQLYVNELWAHANNEDYEEDPHVLFLVVPRARFEGEVIVNNWWLSHRIIIGSQEWLQNITPTTQYSTRRHIWIKFVGSLLCSEILSPLTKNQHLI